MPGKALGIDGGRSHDQFQIRSFAQQGLQITQEKIDIEAALVGLVDDQGVVGRQIAIGLDFRQQDAIGHEFDMAALGYPLGETHLIADRAAQLYFQFLRHPLGHGPGGQATWLGTTDQATGTAPGGQAHLGQLGGLA